MIRGQSYIVGIYAEWKLVKYVIEYACSSKNVRLSLSLFSLFRRLWKQFSVVSESRLCRVVDTSRRFANATEKFAVSYSHSIQVLRLIHQVRILSFASVTCEFAILSRLSQAMIALLRLEIIIRQRAFVVVQRNTSTTGQLYREFTHRGSSYARLFSVQRVKNAHNKIY